MGMLLEMMEFQAPTPTTICFWWATQNWVYSSLSYPQHQEMWFQTPVEWQVNQNPVPRLSKVETNLSHEVVVVTFYLFSLIVKPVGSGMTD